MNCRSALAAFACAVAGAAAAPFAHPGVLHTAEDIAFVREKVAAGEEPWRSFWSELERDPLASLEDKPNPHAHVERGPYNNPSRGANELMRDAAAAYTHALHWSISGEKAHAAKAIDVLDAYAGTLESVGHHDARLLVGMSGIHLVNAAELLRHGSADWPEGKQEAFSNLLRKVLYPVIADFYPTANGNWDAAMLQTMLAMAVFLDDRQMFDRACRYFRRGEGNGCVSNYFKPSGQCQESGRDQSHTQMGLGYLACAAEIAWNQGVDLYAEAGARLAAGFEYTAKYNLGHDDVPFEEYVSVEGRYRHKKISADGRGRFSPIYEIALRHYRGREGRAMPYTAYAVERSRPEDASTTFVPWASLMFGGRAPLAESPALLAADQSDNRIRLYDPTDSNRTLWCYPADGEEPIQYVPTDAKRVIHEGAVHVLAAYHGRVRLVRIYRKKVVKDFPSWGSCHSAELLPDGSIVTANSNHGKLRLHRGADDFVDYELPYAHGVTWDKKDARLWALGDLLYRYRYEDGGLVLEERFELPPTPTGHDLFPYREARKLLVSNNEALFAFDIAEGSFENLSGLHHIKSASQHPDGSIWITDPADLEGVPAFQTDSVVSLAGAEAGRFKREGSRFYKARWWQEVPFSY